MHELPLQVLWLFVAGMMIGRWALWTMYAVVVDRSTRSLRDSLSDAVSRGQELETANRRLEAKIVAREPAQEQLLHAQKIETVGHMASGVAHDFNHLLGLILGYAQRARTAAGRGRRPAGSGPPALR